MGDASERTSARRDTEEALDVVGELLEAVLEEVWGGERESEEAGGSGRGDGGSMDLCQLCWNQLRPRVLSGLSLRGARAELLQLKTVEQRASGYCGHYALYFCLSCVGAWHSAHLAGSVAFLEKTGEAGGFWRRYWLSVSLLLARVRRGEEGGEEGGAWWPWTQDHVLSGDMERSYLHHLLHGPSRPHLLANVLVLHYAYGCIHNTCSEVCAMQQRIDAFRASPGPAHLPFILGVTNHWVFLLAYKTAATAACRSKVGLLYLDSNNVSVLGASDAALAATVADKEKERLKRKGRGYSQWKRGVVYQAFVDQRDVVWLLARCVTGAEDLRARLLAGHWASLLDSYQRHVPAGEGEGSYVVQLLRWLEGEHHPRTLLDNHVPLLRRLGAGLLDAALRDRVEDWVQACRRGLGEGDTGLTTVELFRSVLHDTAALCGLTAHPS